MKKTVYKCPSAQLFALESADIITLSLFGELGVEEKTDDKSKWFGGLHDPYYIG